MTRNARWLVFAITAAAALALGAAAARWRSGPALVAAQGADALFAQTFTDVQGREQALSQWRGKLLVVNFWATWCAPCIEEMPALQRVRDEYRVRDVEIVGIGIDRADNIREFATRLGITLPLLVAGAGGSELGRALGNTAGVLPFTVLVTPEGRVVERRVGQISAQQLRSWLDSRLGKPNRPA